MTDSWPRYEPVTFSIGVNVSREDLDTLNRALLPKRALGVGDALEEPVGIDVPGRGYLIRFAHGGFHSYCFDPATGEVLELSDWPGMEPYLVNTTLDQFTRTVKAVTGAFPYYDDMPIAVDDVEADARIAERVATAARIGDLLREIDPVAMAPDGFWDNFLVDVGMGDYSTEDVLREDDSDPGHGSTE